ncbi:MAG: hypothetical protein U0904_02180 [Candidatus Nanopelagicales bacterium]|nr:hypothetical protein [Candidatus Nanopelagicales bacterium]
MRMTWYAASLGAGGVTRGMPFLALLLFASQIGPDEFARVAMLAVASAWLTLLSSGGLEFTAIFEERRRLDGRPPRPLAPAWFVALPVAALAGLCFAGFAILVGFPFWQWAVMVGSAVVLGLCQMPVLGRARIRHDKRALIEFVFIPFLAAGLLRIAALIVVGSGSSLDVLWLWVSGDVAQAAIVIIFAIRRIGLAGLRVPTRQTVRDGVATTRRSGPWVLTAGLQGALANLDKFLLYGLVSSETFGVYALSYQLANIANILVSEYNKARYGRIIRQSVSGAVARLAAESGRYLLVLASGGAVSVLGALLLFRPTYPDIGWMTAILVASLLPIPLYVPLENQVAVLDGRTAEVAMASLAGVITGAAVLLALVGNLGVIAGAIGTFCGYAVTTAVLGAFYARAARRRVRSG